MGKGEVQIVFKGKNDDLLDSIDEVGDGLSELDKRQAKAAQEALESLNRTNFSRLKSRIKSIGTTLKAVGSQIKNVGSSITSMGAKLTAGVTAPIVAVATLGIRFNAMKEQALVSFGVLLKSGEKAKALFADLQKFAADTPFEIGGINQATKSLLAFGVAQKDIIPTLKSVGDIASGTGTPLTELAEIYGKAKVQGRLFAEDINQLTGRGIPIIQELAKQFGVSETEVKKLVESGKVGFPQLEKAFKDLTGEGGQFSGMMEAQSKTFSGRFSTLMDNLNVGLGKITEPLFKALSSAMPYIIGFVERVTDAFTNMSPEMQTAISIVLAIVAAFAPLLTILGVVITVVGSVITAVGTLAGAIGALGGLTVVIPVIAGIIGLIVQLAIPIGIAIAQLYLLYLAFENNFGGIKTFTLDVFNAIKSFIGTAMTEIQTVIENGLEQIQQWWAANGEYITEAVVKVYEFLESIVKNALDKLRQFWTNYGDSITTIVKAGWENIKTIFYTGLAIITNAITIIASIINGDWGNAWEIFQNTLSISLNASITLFKSFGTILQTVGIVLAKIVTKIALSIIDSFINTLTFGVINSDFSGLFSSLVDPLEKSANELVPPVEDAKKQLGSIDIFGGLLKSVKEGAKEAIPLIKQSGKELKATLDQLSKNANISPELRKRLQKEVKDIGEKVANEAKEASAKLKKSFGDLQKTLNALLDNPQVSESLKTAIKKELTSIDNQIKNTAPQVKSSGVLLGRSFADGTSKTIANSKGQINTAQKTAVKMDSSFATKQGRQIGIAIVDGIVQGLKNKASSAYEKAKEVVSTVITIMRAVPIIKSPSRVTFEIGQFISEGLALGLESKIGRVKSSAKKVAKETLKELRKAAEEFRKFVGLDSEQVRQIIATDELKKQTQNLQEIIKLRGELGFNLDKDLPSSKDGINKELKYLQDWKQLIEDINQELEETENKRLQNLENFANLQKDIKRQGKDGILQLQEEQQLLRLVDEVEKQRVQNQFDLIRMRQQLKDDGYTEDQINQAIKLQQIENERYLKQLKLLEKRKQVKEAEDLALDLQKQLDELRGVNRELTIYEETLAKIEKDFKNISPGQKEYLLDLAKQTDLLREMKREHAELKESLRDIFGFVVEGDFKGLVKSFADRMKETFIDNVSEFLATKILGFDPNKTDNPVAKPIVKEITTSNKLLQSIDKNIAKATGGTSSATSFGGFGNILDTVFGDVIGGIGDFGSNNNSIGGSQSGSQNTDSSRGFDLRSIFGSGGESGGNFIDNIKNIFSGKDGTLLGKGGVFGEEGFGNNVGTYGGIGSIANIVGGLIGGKAGSVISGVGSGIATGAAIGSIIPGIGTVIGGVLGGIIGGISSLFSSPKKKRDKREKLPALQQGFTETMKQFRELIEQVRTLSVDPTEALSKGKALRSELASGYNLKFESKKYRRISQERINQNLGIIDAQPDGLMSQLQKAASESKAAGDRNKRILPEFSTGVYMDSAFRSQFGEFTRRRGLLPGSFTGKDYLPSLLADGEIIVEPTQRMNVIRNAGGVDVFSNAGIPNYPNTSQPEVMKLSTGGAIGSIKPTSGSVVQKNKTMVIKPNFTVVLEGVAFNEGVKGYMESDEGERVQVKLIKKKQKSGDI